MRNKRAFVTDYDPRFIELARKHVEDGWSYISFSGRHSIPMRTWACWTKDQPALKAIRDEYNLTLKCKRRYLKKVL